MSIIRKSLVIFSIIACSSVYFLHKHSHAQTAVATISGKFYKLDVLATNGMSGITAINSSSINDSGMVAFNATGAGLFTADGRFPLRNIVGPNASAPQITNNNHIIYRSTSIGVSVGTLLRRDTNLPTFPFTTIAGETGTAFPDFTNISDFPSINNNLQAAFSIFDSSVPQTEVVTGIRPSFNRRAVIPGSLNQTFPVVADSGSVVLRTGVNATPATQIIRLYPNYPLTTTPITIAAGANWSRLGQRPGISDDGAVVVFYGELTMAGATALNTTMGPGIFANFDVGGTRRTVRVARRRVENFNNSAGNLDGVCDEPEHIAAPTQCVDGELGQDLAGNALQFASFEPDARIGVVHQPLGPGGIEDDVFIVSFIGTPNAASAAPQYFSNQLGLWTVRVDIKSENSPMGSVLREKPYRPMSVVQIGDLVGAGNQITNITVHDSLALAPTTDTGIARVQRRPDHRIAFSVTTQTGGSLLVRGTHIDSDEDGLPDHWEASGIDFNQDGVIDLALNTALPGDASTLAADPNRKDVFVEMDYMQETGGANPHTHQPGRLPNNSANLVADPILQVRNAFRSSPATNPTGPTGITLHTFLGEALTEVNALQFIYTTRPPGATDDFEDFKFGSNAAPAGVPCGTGANDGHFGTPADRGSPNCSNILGAKRLVFRYSIFAHRVQFAPNPPDLTSGVSEIAGNDFIVSLAVAEAANYDWQNYTNDSVTSFNSTTPAPNPSFTFDGVFSDFQAGTFMHELGHSLGLLHGGDQRTNCKPNYLSIMSYSRQFNQRGLSTINIPGTALNSFILTNRRLNYSSIPALPANELNEASLLEANGINGPAGERTVHGRQADGFTLISGANGPIDWNNSGVNQPTAIAADVNWLQNIHSTQCGASPGQILGSHNDWGNLRFNFFGSIGFSDGSIGRILVDGKDLDAFDALNGALGSSDVDNDTVLNANDNCIFSPNLSQSDSNSNGIGDACDPLTTILADVSVVMTESADPVLINTQFDYTATVSNAGQNASQNVDFNYTLPANVTLNSVTPSQGSCSGTSNITCSLGTINGSSNATVTIRVTPTVPGKLDNWVDANSGGGSPTADPNILNNTSSASTTILDPSQTFTISGRITDTGSAGIGGAFVRYSGGSQGTAITDANGDYTFPAISGGIYTLIPYKFGFGFVPQSRTVAYISSNQVVDFTGVAAVTETDTIADFDGDQRTDISIWRPSDGNWHLDRSIDGYVIYAWGVSGDQIVPFDFDGDNKTDVSVFRPSNSTWYILNSGDSTVSTIIWGASTDIPTVGDYDSDGKADVAVYRPADNTFYILKSSGGTQTNTWGVAGDVPVVGDFDGDGQSDIAVRRPSTGEWFINRSTAGYISVTWGVGTDVAVHADYDGDGEDDVAVWRPSTGEWFILRSTDGGTTQSTWGATGDVPVPGDYDGDGKADIAVVRNGVWHISQSTDGYRTAAWGVGTDIAIPGRY